jgi:two-component system OmpR family sensor kinase
LVEDLLLAGLDKGQPLKLSEVDLTQLVIESASDEKVMVPGYKWRRQLPDEPVVVAGGPSQLRQVLTNLLSNAPKHTSAGTTAEKVSGCPRGVHREGLWRKGNGDVTAGVHCTCPATADPVTLAARRRAVVVISVTKM